MHRVGWQHSAGTQSSLMMQLCAGTGIVVTSGETGGVGGYVAVGEIVTTGGVPPVVHPLNRIMTPSVIRRADKSQEIVRAIVLDIQRESDKYLVGLSGPKKSTLRSDLPVPAG